MPTRVRRRSIPLGGRIVPYLVAGSGSPLLIIHGGGAGAESWQHNILELAKNHTVYAPHLPGIGDTPAVSEEFDYPDFVAFVEDFVSGVNLSSFDLMGHSLGGCLALQYALKHPEKVNSLVLVSSMGLGKEVGLLPAILTSRAICNGVSLRLFGGAVLLRELLGSAAMNPIHMLRCFPRVTFSMWRRIIRAGRQTLDLSDRLCELSMPTMIVWGSRDLTMPVQHAYKAVRLIPDCRIHVIPGCGHSVYRQKLDEFTEVIDDFTGRSGLAPLAVDLNPGP